MQCGGKRECMCVCEKERANAKFKAMCMGNNAFVAHMQCLRKRECVDVQWKAIGMYA